ncbi:GMC oxidoreductase [Apiospora rasikravindrae]|uniref:GMC oxidoreductase n=1 Tax=Apiospora rasikravindrae TaxID=990691 RepID=A0ABR1RZ45_9PEZI
MYIVGTLLSPNLPTIGSAAAWMAIIFERGNIIIRSAGRLSLSISPNCVDAHLALAAFKRLREIWKTDAANAIKDGPEHLPGSDVQPDSRFWLTFATALLNPGIEQGLLQWNYRAMTG